MQQIQSRRELLKWSAASAAGLALSSLTLAEESKKKIPIGMQLYSVRELLKTQFTETIEKIGKLGFKGVEFAGYYDWDKKPAELRKLLDDNGLQCCGTHTALPTLVGDNLKKTIELHKTLGNNRLICPFLLAKSPNQWMDLAKQFNDIAAKAKEDGMFVGYHSHQHDFHKLDGKTTWEIFFDNTNPEVIHQIDTGNTLQGGGDPMAMVKKYSGRTKSTHIKEFGGPAGAAMGEGTIDWKSYFETYESVGGTEWYIIEYEHKEPLAALKKSIDFMHKMGR